MKCWIVNNQIIENLEFCVCAHCTLFFFFLVFHCHWTSSWCAVDVLRCAQLHQLDRNSLVHQPQQHGAAVLLQEHHRLHRQARPARPAQPAGTGRPCSKRLTCLALIWRFDGNDRSLTGFFFFCLAGLWDRVGQPLPGCAGLCPAGHFRLCNHQGKAPDHFRS